MSVGTLPSTRTQAERTIAVARVALACTSLIAVWLDPAEPARYAELTYTLHAIYVVYSVALVVYTWLRAAGSRLPLVTHVADIAAFSVFQFLTLGPSSPFFVYFVFSMFCGAMRWGWRATLATAGVVAIAYLSMTIWMTPVTGPVEFELNRAIIRTMYLIVSAGLLVYLGRYEARMRDEIERLARWPSPTDVDVDRATERLLDHAAQIMGARRGLVVWEASEEPAVHVVNWSPSAASAARHAPAETAGLTPAGFEAATFVCTDAVHDGSPLLVAGADMPDGDLPRLALTPLLRHLDGAAGLASAPFSTEQVSGRVFFGDLGIPGAEIVPLTRVVAREIGTSLERLQIAQQLREIAASEERIRVARDLHDGVLQSLTGIRLEIRALASSLDRTSESSRDRLHAIERALAIEQRELRTFIDGLGPARSRAAGDSLTTRLDVLRERIALEWKTPVTVRVTPGAPDVPAHVADAVPLMIHEAVVNALKHGAPSRVAVTVERRADEIRVVVADDGHGFPFRGRYDHASLATMSSVPQSLLDRVTSLGGRLSIESTEAGSRVEMALSL